MDRLGIREGAGSPRQIVAMQTVYVGSGYAKSVKDVLLRLWFNLGSHSSPNVNVNDDATGKGRHVLGC